MPTYLTPKELAARYGGAIAPKTLANWRSQGKGPPYVKLGGRVVYALHDVLEWEKSRRPRARNAVDGQGPALEFQ